MNNSIRPLIILLVALAGLLFVYAIFQAGINTLELSGKDDSTKATIHSFYSNAVIIISGILSTNFGAVLGVTLSPPSAPAALATKFLGLRSSIKSVSMSANTSTTDISQKFQIIACWVYVGGLLLATVFYLIAISKSIDDDNMIPLLAELSKTLIGVLFGALTVALGR